MTKSEILAELIDLRKSIETLKIPHKHVEAKKKAPSKTIKPRENRKTIKADIEFIGVFDLVKAQAINVSEGGISLKISNNLPFEMRYKLKKKIISRTAHLVWVKHTENGGYNFGFKFVKGESFPNF